MGNFSNPGKHIKLNPDIDNTRGYPNTVQYVKEVINRLSRKNKKAKKSISSTIKEKYKTELHIAVGPQSMMDSSSVDEKNQDIIIDNQYSIDKVCQPEARHNLSNFIDLLQPKTNITLIRMLGQDEYDQINGFNLGPWLASYQNTKRLYQSSHIFDDDLSLGEKFNQISDKIAKDIIKAIENQESILIACKAGQSRSTAVTLAIYALLDNKEFAVKLCKSVAVYPNTIVLMKLLESLSNEGYKIPEWIFNYYDDEDYGLHETGKYKIMN
jgi:predicted protein tyrosine phosphatase